MTTNMILRDALEHYRERVSILKKGYLQERYRIQQLTRTSLGVEVVPGICRAVQTLLVL